MLSYWAVVRLLNWMVRLYIYFVSWTPARFSIFHNYFPRDWDDETSQNPPPKSRLTSQHPRSFKQIRPGLSSIFGSFDLCPFDRFPLGA